MDACELENFKNESEEKWNPSLEKNHPELAFPLADLPDLVLLNVANQLSNDDARNLSLTCMRFQVSNM